MDPAFWALDLGHPLSVEGSSSGINSETTPLASIIRYQFGPRKNMPPVKVTWYGGGLMPPQPDELEPGRKLTGGGNGILFVGDKGKKLTWDGPNMKATNAPEADKYIRPEYHNGWTL